MPRTSRPKVPGRLRLPEKDAGMQGGFGTGSWSGGSEGEGLVALQLCETLAEAIPR